METGKVYLREEGRSVTVVHPDAGLEVPEHIQNKWQNLVDLISSIFQVPSSLVMRVDTRSIEVFLKSSNADNPYRAGDKEVLGHGLYCETAIGRDEMLEIPDALKNIPWKDNPDMKLGMMSYLGYPLKWPDGSVFGTICALDSKPRNFEGDMKQLMAVFSSIIESDLKSIYDYSQLNDENRRLDTMIREIHHRIKNNLNTVISYMQLKKNASEETVQQLVGDIEVRMRAFAGLHEKIYRSISLNPDFSDYIQNLAREALTAMGRDDIDLSLKVDNITGSQFSLDAGMVVAELITNSVKYALPAGDSTGNPPVSEDLRISLEILADRGRVHMRYSDYGPGISDTHSQGFGMVMFEGFAQRYDGEFALSGDAQIIWEFRNLLPG
ncbi:histidine kinase dimerization/phosphoacceptor domain -containing protein [Salinispira pacifica]|uniref:histidine kinase n=1 Tax=Salinispira pacifica TaxID=1307761 RepID=V5WGH1_9SPIO|nr:histidine kinase dimerization/phosphoacceptor domain -containing protein [Salinispira pacifica]AHC14883.1 GGDEF family protein [Salinispira pacifica]